MGLTAGTTGRISGILSPAVARFPVICLSDQPESPRVARIGTGRPCDSLFDLAPGGVCLAPVTSRPPHGGLLHRRFNLTGRTLRRVGGWFLWHFPFPPFARGIPHLPGADALPCGVRTISSGGRACARPAATGARSPGCQRTEIQTGGRPPLRRKIQHPAAKVAQASPCPACAPRTT